MTKKTADQPLCAKCTNYADGTCALGLLETHLAAVGETTIIDCTGYEQAKAPEKKESA